MGEWPLVTLGDLVTIQHGFAFRGEYFCDNQTRFSLVTPGNFAIGGGFVPTTKFYDGPVPDAFVLRPGDLLVTMTDLSKNGDTLGLSAVVPEIADLTFLHNQRVGKVRVISDSATPRFLEWVMRSRPYREEVLASATGTTVRHTSPSRICAYSFPLPSLSEQHRIADVLGALEAKVASNVRAIALLDELFLAECTALAGRFDSGERVRLGELAQVQLGGTPSRHRSEFWEGGGIGWINSGCLHQRPVLLPADMITELGLRSSATKVAPAGSTVLAITGATLGVVSRLAASLAFNQSVIAVHSDGDPRMTSYLYFWLRTNIGELVKSATGAAQQHVNRSNVCDLMVHKPGPQFLAEMVRLGPLLEDQNVLARQNRTLVETRDTLLPELLSGRLRVPIVDQRGDSATSLSGGVPR